MNSETLKKLIEVEYERCETISQFKKEVFRLIDLYDSEIQNKNIILDNIYYNNGTISHDGGIRNSEKVYMFEVCPCNPKNGGSGICGCAIGNTLVNKPL